MVKIHGCEEETKRRKNLLQSAVSTLLQERRNEIELSEVESKWSELNKKEHDLETQLEETRQEKMDYFKHIVSKGFYWCDGKWMKEVE